LENLVGAPTDGIQFNLFGIVDQNEEVLLSVGDELHKNLMPRLMGVDEHDLANVFGRAHGKEF
jgi:hypothetical protein